MMLWKMWSLKLLIVDGFVFVVAVDVVVVVVVVVVVIKKEISRVLRYDSLISSGLLLPIRLLSSSLMI